MWLFAGCSRVGHVLLRPGDLDMDSIVKRPSLFSYFHISYLFRSSNCLSAVPLCSLSPSDLSSSCSPLGRSMHTMTAISDHTLFIYGGLGADGNTLSKSQPRRKYRSLYSLHLSACSESSNCTSRILLHGLQMIVAWFVCQLLSFSFIVFL